MIDLKDMECKPTLDEIDAYIGNPLFKQFWEYMSEKYKALYKLEYSRDVLYSGWNIKLRKGGRALCAIYPNQQYFTLLIVIGKKEKERCEAILPRLSEEMLNIYHSTKEGNGQRWLMINLYADNDLYRDALQLIHIRKSTYK